MTEPNWAFQHPWLLLLLPALWLLAAWLWRGRGRSRVVWLLRLAIVALLVVALADPQRVHPVVLPEPVVLVVDQSASLGAERATTLRELAARAQERTGAATRVILFGERALVLPPGFVPPALPDDLGAEGTDLAGALALASQLLPRGDGRIVLLSDGGDTSVSDRTGASPPLSVVADRLVAQGVPVDVWPVPLDQPADVGLTSLDVPPVVRQGETYAVDVIVTASAPGRARLELWQGSRRLAQEDVELSQGPNPFSFEGQVATDAPLGFAPFRALIRTEGDGEPRNDELTAATEVAAEPHVLLVGDPSGGFDTLRTMLASQGMLVEVRAPEGLPDGADQLAAYDAVWLVDVSAERLTLAQMTTLQTLARDLGKGLVVSGGPNSFSTGEYENTPLEAALPVRAEPPPRAVRRGVTMLLILDHSASMELTETTTPGAGPTKFEMAQRAAILAVQSLTPNDRIGVLRFDDDTAWVVPFQTVGAGLQREQIRQQILAVQSGGGTDIPQAMAVGFEALAGQPPGARHAVLLTDGRSSNATLEQYRALVALAREADITLSTIAIGLEADRPLLERLAEWGEGRYAFAARPEEIPALTIRESELLRAETQQEGLFRAELATAHPTVRGFTPAELPQIEGYLATTPRPQSETVLAAPEGDPLLSAWQYGLGRSVVWTSDVLGPWTRAWAEWPDAARFWANLVRYTLPDPLVGPLALRVSVAGNVATVEADALEANGTPINQATLRARIAPAGESAAEAGQGLALRQIAPGRYRQTVRLPEPGVYRVSASLDHEGQTLEAGAAVVRPYPAEFRPNVEGPARLRALALRTGGRELASPAELLPEEVEPPPPPYRVAPFLIAAALALWPLEIALRRGWLTRLRNRGRFVA